ncbi:Cytoplasmic dynein 1 intermediate chain 2 [Exaiptasia diaphana]|nr:Cytoplasmic dynein 1 intermediate chain 2 [Exaiptasia diaphana]
MSDRKAELERKRKRLEEIRRARNEKKKNEQESARQTATSASTESATERKQRETDELLKGILPDDVIDGSAVTVALQKPATTKAEGSPVKAPMTQIIQKKAPVLVVSQTAQTNIPPKEPVLYSKETQTPVLTNQKDDDDEDEDIKKLKKPEIIAAPEPEIDFSYLFLTSSFDWTLKLWSHKSHRPVYSFEDNGDYIYDVQWSPIHPALFATVDGMGKLDLWNLNTDTEVPITSSATEMTSLNRVRWTNSGHQIAVGDDDGKVFIYDVGEQLAVPRADEWSRLQNTLIDIQANASSSVSETIGSPRMSPSKIPFT